jgi:hypothetical protein
VGASTRFAAAAGESVIGSITLRFDWAHRRADLGNVTFAPYRDADSVRSSKSC